MKKSDDERRLSVMLLAVIVALGVALVVAVLLTNGDADETPREMTDSEELLVAALALEVAGPGTLEALCLGRERDADRLERMARQELEDVSYEVWVYALDAKCAANS